MALTYAELTAHVQDTVEDVFTTEQLRIWTQQTEQKIYNTVQFPDMRKTFSGPLTINDREFTLPDDYVYTHSFAVIDGDSKFHFLINKDVNFIREAYPVETAYGLPKHYANLAAYTFLLGPSPDAAYDVQLNYGYYPESIVTAGTTWLGDVFDTALLNGVLVEAARFIKAEQDMVDLYRSMYMESIAQLKMLAEGKLRQDSYRSGQHRVPVS